MFTRLLLFGFVLFSIGIVYLANSGQSDYLIWFVDNIPFGDKAGHFIIPGILTLLTNLALDCRYISLGKANILLGTIIISILVMLEEYSQLYIPRRTFSFGDLLFDFMGILAFSALSIQIQKWRKRK